jgi:hypothetical protein
VLLAQSGADSIITGRVSSKSVENIYVIFDDSEGIEKGDTIFVKVGETFIPAIKVNYTSSRSVAGTPVKSSDLKKDDKVYAFVNIITEEKKLLGKTGVLTIPQVKNDVGQPTNKISNVKSVESRVSGRFTIQSYSNFSNQGRSYDYQRWRYAFKLEAKNISGSNLSYTHYINFAYRANEWNKISSNIGQALRIYDLALRYDFSGSTSLWLGRHINRKASNIGSVDGLQFETSFPALSIGIIAGSRPNLSDMGFNAKLFEYGVYISRFDAVGQRGMDNTLGYFEQTNDFKTDRRFLYFQHSNSAIQNTRLFLSTEIDLFKKVNGKSENEISLTSFFVSANIRASNYVSFYLSYDARKNVIYYESFKNFIDSVFENETRQGLRTRITLKPIRNLFLGLNYGYRFRKGDPKPSNNYGGYITYSSVPVIESGLTFSFTKLFSNYVRGTIWSLRLYKDLKWGMGIALGYRNTKYQFLQNISDATQQSVSFNVNTRLFKPVFINFTYEGVFQSTQSSGRILINLSYRF